MRRIDLLIFVALLGLILLGVKEACAYDLDCKLPSGESLIISTPYRTFSSTITTDKGQLRTVRIVDTLSPSKVDDYATYTDGKHRVTYWLECERF